MELEDFLEPEIAVTAVVAAAIFSPGARKILRRGLVYGTAGALIAGDAVTTFARRIGQGNGQAAQSAPAGEATNGQPGQPTQEGQGG